MYLEILVNEINARMNADNLTRQNVADLCDVPLGTLNRLLSGNTDDVKSYTCFKIAKGLNISLDAIADISPPSLPPSGTPAHSPCDYCRDHGQIAILREVIATTNDNLTTQAAYHQRTAARLAKEKRVLFTCLMLVVLFVFALFAIDILNPTVGWFRY